MPEKNVKYASHFKIQLFLIPIFYWMSTLIRSSKNVTCDWDPKLINNSSWLKAVSERQMAHNLSHWCQESHLVYPLMQPNSRVRICWMGLGTVCARVRGLGVHFSQFCFGWFHVNSQPSWEYLHGKCCRQLLSPRKLDIKYYPLHSPKGMILLPSP